MLGRDAVLLALTGNDSCPRGTLASARRRPIARYLL